MQLLRIIIFLLLVLSVLWIPSFTMADELAGDPAVSEETGTDRHTQEEFDALSDDEKRDVYFNHPQQLPDNFQSTQYMDLLHQPEGSE